MDVVRALGVSASGLAAQRARMEVITANLANSETTAPAGSRPYQRQMVLLHSADEPGFAALLSGSPVPPGGVRVGGVVPSAEPPRRLYQPGHPHAGPDGFVTLPNVNPLREMVDMVLSTRAYEANVAAFQATKSMAARLLELLR